MSAIRSISVVTISSRPKYAASISGVRLHFGQAGALMPYSITHTHTHKHTNTHARTHACKHTHTHSRAQGCATWSTGADGAPRLLLRDIDVQVRALIEYHLRCNATPVVCRADSVTESVIRFHINMKIHATAQCPRRWQGCSRCSSSRWGPPLSGAFIHKGTTRSAVNSLRFDGATTALPPVGHSDGCRWAGGTLQYAVSGTTRG
jgi:hypothetical protein